MPHEIFVTVKGEIKKIPHAGAPSKRIPTEIQCYTVLEFVKQYFDIKDEDITKIKYMRNSDVLYEWNYDNGRQCV
jgi:hypothetical protein